MATSQPSFSPVPHLQPITSAAGPRDRDVPVLDQSPVVQAEAAKQAVPDTSHGQLDLIKPDRRVLRAWDDSPSARHGGDIYQSELTTVPECCAEASPFRIQAKNALKSSQFDIACCQ